METYQVVKSKVEKNGVITHEVTGNNGKLKTFHYSAVRAGLNWPSPEASAFYVILAEEYVGKTKYEGQQRQRGKLKIFKEQEISSSFLDKLFSKFSDDCMLFGCKHAYTDLSDDHEADAEFFHNFIYDKKIPHISLEEAPFVDSFSLGVSLIKRFMSDGFLDIPEDSVIREQLKRLAKSDLQDPQAEKRFNAVNALRFVIGAFYKFIPTAGGFTPNRRKSFYK